MRLRKVSSWFFAVVLLVLGANAMFLVLITKSYDSVVAAQNHRQAALGLADELHQETEQLARLVRAYTATGEPRYLLYYYDILAIRQGEKTVPTNFNPNSYWDDVIAERIKHDLPKDGNKHSVADLMKSTGFSDSELLALKRVLVATAAMNKIEQKAFAATQGLYNPETEEFVSDGPARLDFAGMLVHSNEYNALKADLATAVDDLVAMTDRRTSAEVAAAGQRMERWILLSLVSMCATIVMAVLALRVIRRDVLVPIHRLGRGADRLAAGDYATRTGALRGFDELTALGRTVDSMAQAIEDDIGRSHAVQKELETARKQAEDATHAKSIFLANMSHEIRTPMNAILGMAYLALRTGLNARQHDYVTKIHDAAKSLLGIINDILDFSKVEAGKLELDEGRFRIEDVAGNSLSLLRQRAHEKDIELLFDVTESRLLGESGALMGDALRLGQVITNLLSNAVKFTHQGYVKLMVGIERVDVDSLTLLFTVRDTGIGMTEEQIGRLFQEFTQADGSTTRKYGGTGLGLTISKRIVELMGGRIWVQSVSGEGSSLSFTARFPFTQPPAAPSAPLPRADAMRVLVVDDQPDARLALQDLLGALGVGTAHPGRVDCSDDGDTALVMIEQARQRGQPYDLILIDWVMPGLDGAGVLKALQDKPGAGAPLSVIVSAYDSELLHASVKALGAEHFLPKPVLPESLRELIKWLGGDGATDATSSPAAATAANLGALRVLLVEDNAINQQLAVELMESRGVQVDVATNGQEGLDRIDAHSPAYYGVVLMDLQMPVMDGYEATRLLRLDARYVNLPIIAMTAHAMADERQRCLVLGMNGHLSKPIDPETLYDTLATFDAGASESRPGPVTAPAAPIAPGGHGAGPAALQVAGLDTKPGLRHADGNASLYSQLLRRFAVDFSGFSARVESMLATDNWDAAVRETHTLKGLCATLGASEIQPLAAALEKAMQARNRDCVVEELAHTGVAVEAMTSALHAQFAIDDASRYDTQVLLRAHDTSNGADARPFAFDEWLAHLRDLLRHGDNEARDLWQTGLAQIHHLLPVDVVDRVTRSLSNYQLDEVLDMLPKPPADAAGNGD